MFGGLNDHLHKEGLQVIWRTVEKQELVALRLGSKTKVVFINWISEHAAGPSIVVLALIAESSGV